MSYNGSGTFNINSAGQPVVTGTVITSTAFNALTSDLANGLTTALTKDGQTTPTANIPMGNFKITGLAAGTAVADAVRLSQLQNGSTTSYITVTGTDTITGTVTPTLTAYATGQQFSFVVAATNTAAVTLNVDGIGAKAVTRTGSVALVAGDMVTGQVVIVEYDGTRFQLLNGNSFTNLKASGTLSVTGVATLGNGAILGTPASGTVTNLTGTASININGTVGATTAATGAFTTLSATGVATFAAGSAPAPAITTTGDTNTGVYFPAADTVGITAGGTERMRIIASPDTTFTGAASFFRTGASPYNGVVIGDGSGYNFVFGHVSNFTGLFVPGVTLSDTGAVAIPGVATFAAGTVALPSITTSGDTNTGVYFPAADTVGITAGGTQRGAFSSTGLAVTGTITSTGTITGNSDNANFHVNSTNASGYSSVYFQLSGVNKAAIYRHHAAGQFILSTQGAADPILLAVNSLVIATVSSTGLAVAGVLTSTGTISPQQVATAGAPAYVKGAIYFDTTLNKLCVGGATAWETITSI